MKPSEALRQSAETYEERNALYGDNYHRHGEVMKALFPNGVILHSVSDHNRFGILTQKVSKLTRYCHNFETGGHDDSLLDDVTYTAMLRELDSICHSVEFGGPLSHPRSGAAPSGAGIGPVDGAALEKEANQRSEEAGE